MKPLTDCRLYGFIDLAYVDASGVELAAEALVGGGADLVQLRAKQHSREEVLALGRRVLPVLRAAGVGLVINDHPETALELGAELCHLGQEDFFDAGYTHVSEVPGTHAGLQIGLSTHAPEQAERAIRAGAAYIAIGPVYPTGTKPSAKAVTLAYVRWAAGHVVIPWFAIGGITLANLEAVLEAGATRVCVVSAILRAPNVRETCHAFRARLGHAAEQRHGPVPVHRNQ